MDIHGVEFEYQSTRNVILSSITVVSDTFNIFVHFQKILLNLETLDGTAKGCISSQPLIWDFGKRSIVQMGASLCLLEASRKL